MLVSNVNLLVDNFLQTNRINMGISVMIDAHSFIIAVAFVCKLIKSIFHPNCGYKLYIFWYFINF